MASSSVGNLLRVVDKRNSSSIITDPSAAIYTNIKDVASLRARLTAINAGIYTTDFLNHMTENDMIYAVRINDDPTSGVNG